jgi:hypothetical protein
MFGDLTRLPANSDLQPERVNLLERSPRTYDLRLWINQSLSFSWVYPALAKPLSGPD